MSENQNRVVPCVTVEFKLDGVSGWLHKDAPHSQWTPNVEDRAVFEVHDGIAHAAMHYASFWPGSNVVPVEPRVTTVGRVLDDSEQPKDADTNKSEETDSLDHAAPSHEDEEVST